MEHEYTRGGAWAHLAALDVHRAKLFGRCEQTTGIAPFNRLVAQVMTQCALPVSLRKLGITADMALRLAKRLGTSPQFWMRLQADWDLHQTMQRAERKSA